MRFIMPRACLLATTFCCLFTCRGFAQTKSKPALPDDPRVQVMLDYFEKNGITLKPDKDGGWIATQPKAGTYDVVVHFRVFPPDWTEKQMQEDLQTINLAYMLNSKLRLAMSHPGLRGGEIGKMPVKLDDEPVVAKLKKLFKEYKPPEPGK